MQNDRLITISTAGSRLASKWPASTLLWSELVAKLQTPVRSKETLAEYLLLPKGQQDNLKDVGGFVAGKLDGGRRKANAVTGRDVITLDLDNIPAGGTQNILQRVEGLGCGYAVYSTRKHEEAGPRLRVLVPLDRTATADEYEPLARKLASIIGIEFSDPTTFEASRLMYWPSCCADSQYVYTYGDKPMLSVDGMLAMYGDWRNVAEWPQVPGTQDKHIRLAKRQGDPTAKGGVVGAFCRSFDVLAAMDKLIPGEYGPCDGMADRYTYLGGSTTGGAVVYDDGKFLYSHHATDPCGGRLVNAFDLVRLHKFGELDDDAKAGTPTNRLPSYTAMCKFAVEDAGVAALLNQERYDKMTEVFADSGDNAAPAEGVNLDWIKELAVSPATGNPAQTIDNVLIILSNDPLIKGKIAYDEFAGHELVLGPLPWDEREGRRRWGNPDDSGVQHYLEKVYKITGKDRIANGVERCAHNNKINDVVDYLEGLKWDGINRLDTLLIDYLGAEDNVYTRAVMRKSLSAAVARALEPGTKYDYMPIFVGAQGIGKSTFLRLLGKRWYSDSLQSFEGKEAAEMLQGTWINELGELNGLSRSENNAVKQFLSKTEDIYRKAYGRRTENYPRRCVFFGTTNDSEFLRDRTGNRRFWPLDVGVNKPTKNIFTEMENEVDQIWAEAVQAYKAGEQLYLTGDAEKLSILAQEGYRVSSAKEGIIADFVLKKVPSNWDDFNLQQRLMFWQGGFKGDDTELVERDKICAAEVWCECFKSDLRFMKRADSMEINSILESLPEWEKTKTPRRFGPAYGNQRGFKKSE